VSQPAEGSDQRDRQVAAAKNQSLFRAVNEQVEELQGGRAAHLSDWVCECANVDCIATVELSLAEYEAVRRIPTHFLVHPGHVVPDVERVVTENDRYTVVEKFGHAGVAAIRLDPRTTREASV
jgi:hypothetical protein